MYAVEMLLHSLLLCAVKADLVREAIILYLSILPKY